MGTRSVHTSAHTRSEDTRARSARRPTEPPRSLSGGKRSPRAPMPRTLASSGGATGGAGEIGAPDVGAARRVVDGRVVAQSRCKRRTPVATAHGDAAQPVVGTWAELADADEDAVSGEARRVRGGCGERWCSGAARRRHATAPGRCQACAYAARGGVALTGVALYASAPLRTSGVAVVEERGHGRSHCIHAAAERDICAGQRWCECDGIGWSTEARGHWTSDGCGTYLSQVLVGTRRRC